MINEKSKNLGLLLYTLDFITVSSVYLLSFFIQHQLSPYGPISVQQHLFLLPFLSFSFCWGMSYARAYQKLNLPLVTFGLMIISSLLFSIGAIFTVLFLFDQEWLSRIVIAGFCVNVLIFVFVIRFGLIWWNFKRKNARSANVHHVLVIGTGSRAEKVTELLSSQKDWPFEVVGYLDTDKDLVGTEVGDGKVIGHVEDIDEVLKNNIVDEVVVAIPRTMMGEMKVVFSVCEEEGIKVWLMSDIFDFQFARMQLDFLGNTPMLSFEPVALNNVELLFKRLFDVCAVLAAAPVLIPVFLIVGLAIKLDSPGPVFFQQSRVGLRKRQFPMYKFRSMCIDAEEKMKEIEHLNEADGPIFKIKDDPRVTRVGKFIRKTSLDELPQLINVLLGHMSLVGPRPMSNRDVDLFDRSEQRKRFSVRPGLTCIWQISGRSNLPFEKWLELDLTYIDHWSFRLDIEILFKTIPVILKGEGAV